MLDDICFGLEYMNFSTLRHLPSKRNILTTIAPNHMRQRLLEIRHLELFVHIKFKENGTRKGLKTAMRRLGHKSNKDEKC